MYKSASSLFYLGLLYSKGFSLVVNMSIEEAYLLSFNMFRSASVQSILLVVIVFTRVQSSC